MKLDKAKQIMKELESEDYVDLLYEEEPHSKIEYLESQLSYLTRIVQEIIKELEKYFAKKRHEHAAKWGTYD